MRTVWLAVALVAVSSCKKSETPAPVKPVVVTPPKKPLVTFELAKPTIIDEAAPVKFSAPPPASEEAVEDALTDELFRLRLEKSAAVRAQALVALEKSVREGAVPAKVERYYAGVFGYRPNPEVCVWLAKSVPGASKAVRATLLHGLSGCHRPTDAALFETGASDDTYLDWCFALENDERIPFSPRPGAFVRRMMASSSSNGLRGIGFCFAKMNGPVLKEVTALLAGPGDDKRKATVTLGLLRSADPALVTLGRKACDVLKDDPMCAQFRPTEENALRGVAVLRTEPGADAGVSEVVEYFGAASDEVRKRFGPTVATKTLETCARRGDERAAECLRTLASSDRASALRLVGLYGDRLKKNGDGVGVLTRTLLAFPDGGVQARLVADGLLPVNANALEQRDVTVERMLEESGRVLPFDVETGMFPNQHHVLLTKLAQLTPALSDVVFDEIAPLEEQMDDGPYELRAWVGGKRYSVTAQNNGDWYDVTATLGLLNALLLTKQSDERFVVLPSDGQIASAMVAPLPALEALVKDGLLEIGASEEAMNGGKEFEEKVFRQLNGEE